MRRNNKGFTLVELLAVIVVLALIMTVAISSILGTSTTAQKKSFNLEGQKILNAAQQYVGTQSAIGKSGVDIAGCYSISDLGVTASGFNGSVKVEYNGSYTYTLYLENGSYMYDGTNSNTVYTEDVTADGAALITVNSSSNRANMTTCKVAAGGN